MKFFFFFFWRGEGGDRCRARRVCWQAWVTPALQGQDGRGPGGCPTGRPSREGMLAASRRAPGEVGPRRAPVSTMLPAMPLPATPAGTRQPRSPVSNQPSPAWKACGRCRRRAGSGGQALDGRAGKHSTGSGRCWARQGRPHRAEHPEHQQKPTAWASHSTAHCSQLARPHLGGGPRVIVVAGHHARPLGQQQAALAVGHLLLGGAGAGVRVCACACACVQGFWACMGMVMARRVMPACPAGGSPGCMRSRAGGSGSQHGSPAPPCPKTAPANGRTAPACRAGEALCAPCLLPAFACASPSLSRDQPDAAGCRGWAGLQGRGAQSQGSSGLLACASWCVAWRAGARCKGRGGGGPRGAGGPAVRVSPQAWMRRAAQAASLADRRQGRCRRWVGGSLTHAAAHVLPRVVAPAGQHGARLGQAPAVEHWQPNCLRRSTAGGAGC